MMTLSLAATENDILAALNIWLQYLAREEYQQAFEFSFHPDGDDSTPEKLREQILFYSDQFNEPVRAPQVSDVEPEHSVVRPNPKAQPAQQLSGGRLLGSYESLVTAQSNIDPTYLGEAVLQIPFGGKWSEVFATFVMINQKGRLVFFLKSVYIH
jgi:hypothetical protein